ncbi:UBP-type zinc finger domain-containing protein [Actinokineospora iranica]|uniref:Ubiquitin-hydrolase Zn-finger-containing protein n=1 Tax=Actinokineospora iranica TaxID=1271860 RepID=A0A1G6Q6J5_9PSEU|nr:UBP-type zinc finger domain-containing protein [Actinokineospora iranica]SDC88092.1 ubiquitin-hydrolase Zn-finger-containing protein [Actinokineospora iranica]
MTCEHVDALPAAVTPDAVDGCQDCLAAGERDWVHLRECLTCGHVACCDSSPRKHATAHYQRTDHPIVRSYEPGESWRWCFVDSRVV